MKKHVKGVLKAATRAGLGRSIRQTYLSSATRLDLKMEQLSAGMS
jgi:hypothetical protein